MPRRFVRVFAAALAFALLSTGCMLSRTVDRAFIGITVRRPSFADRKTTGVFLLPLTFAIDVATFPIQALLVVIMGDQFPFQDRDTLSFMYALNDDPRFQKLNDEQKAVARKELQELMKSGKLTANSALALNDDGHWTVVELTAEARQQLIVRAEGLQQNNELVCAR